MPGLPHACSSNTDTQRHTSNTIRLVVHKTEVGKSNEVLRARELPDPAEGEPLVERVLFNDNYDYSSNVSDRQGRSERKRKKSRHYQ